MIHSCIKKQHGDTTIQDMICLASGRINLMDKDKKEQPKKTSKSNEYCWDEMKLHWVGEWKEGRKILALKQFHEERGVKSPVSNS